MEYQLEDLFRPYHYPQADRHRSGQLSGYGLTQEGAQLYLEHLANQEPETFGGIVPIINQDPNMGEEFTPEALASITDAVASAEGRGEFLIYRQGHTVSLIRENGVMFLMDSYNAFGTDELGNVPLLEHLRNSFPNERIFTMHDMMQRDYHNCVFFATSSLGSVIRELNGRGVDLGQFLNEIDTCILHTPEYTSPDDVRRLDKYTDLFVETVATPACMIPYVQSVAAAQTIADGSHAFCEEVEWCEHGSYQDEMKIATEMRPHKGIMKEMNVCIQRQNEDFRRAVGL